MINAAIGTVIAIVVAIVAAVGGFFGITEGQGSSHPGMENIELSSSTKAPITKEEALNIALKHAGLTKDQVRIDAGDPEYDFDFEWGTAEWEIDFRLANDPRAEYEYEIDAVSGKILKAEGPGVVTPEPSQPEQPSQPGQVPPKVMPGEALEIALKDAGFTRDQVRVEKGDPELDSYRNYRVWDIEFTVIQTGVEYDYKINIGTGEIAHKSIDRF